MQPEGISVEAILGRLQRLERQNRRLRAAVAAGALALAAMALMAVAGPGPQVITARKFLLVDAAGNVRAELAAGNGGPSLVLFDAGGEPQVILEAGTQPHLALYGAGQTSAALWAKGYSPELALFGRAGSGPAGAATASLGVSGSGSIPHLTLSSADNKANAWLAVWGSGPQLSVTDAAGYETDIGVTSTVTPVTGQTQKTSAASIVMFDNSKTHHVIWEAPPSY